MVRLSPVELRCRYNLCHNRLPEDSCFFCLGLLSYRLLFWAIVVYPAPVLGAAVISLAILRRWIMLVPEH